MMPEVHCMSTTGLHTFTCVHTIPSMYVLHVDNLYAVGIQKMSYYYMYMYMEGHSNQSHTQTNTCPMNV